ncbi:MAG: esterase-like activity of phytase family protein [Sedimenticolaceae bacterium]
MTCCLRRRRGVLTIRGPVSLPAAGGAWTLVWLLLTGWALGGAARAGQTQIADIRFIGEATLATGMSFDGTEVGGLSGIDYHPPSDSYFVISDDRSRTDSARFYTLRIDLSDGRLQEGDLELTGRIGLLDADGKPFARGLVDPEGIRFDAATASVFWCSEGDADQQLAPAVFQTALDGSWIRRLDPPSHYWPTGSQGVRDNLAFESLTLSGDRERLITAVENALLQDGPPADLGVPSPVRVLALDKASGAALAEYVYPTDPVPSGSTPPGLFRTNGLVELLALDDSEFLAVERAYAVGVGNSIRLYQASLRDATDVAGVADLHQLPELKPMAKTLLLDLDVLGIRLENTEGVTFGPRLPNGRQSLILVADNNFRDSQTTQFLAFEVRLSHPKDHPPGGHPSAR